MFHIILILAVITGNGNNEIMSPNGRFTYTNRLKVVPTEEVVSCAVFDFMCPDNFSCILWEDRCGNPPCELIPMCLFDVDIFIWLEQCEAIGCAQDACFMRQPRECEDVEDCDVYPDCAVIGGMHILPEQCQRYICPRGYDCEVMNETCYYKFYKECTTTLACVVSYSRMHMENRFDDIRKRFKQVKKPSPLQGVS